jgi:hypothetical protein
MKYLSLLLVSLGIFIIACNDPINIGSEILDQENNEVTLDTLPVSAITTSEDTVISFTENVGNSVYMVGNLDDPIYGQTQATMYFNAVLLGTFQDELKDASLVDSVVMIFEYDTVGQYGQDNIVHDLELFELSEPLGEFDVLSDTLFSTSELEVVPTPRWSGQAFVNHTDSITIGDYLQDTSGLRVEAELRIPLDKEVWTDLFADQTEDIDNDLFSQIVPGFALTSSTSNSLIGINIGLNTVVSNSSRIIFYYRDDEGERNVYGIPLGPIRHNQVLHDDSGSALASDRQAIDPEILYIQPQGGAEIEVDLAALLDEEPFILNSAQIELTVVDPMDGSFRIPDLLNVTFRIEGEEFSVVDFSNISRFDGSPEQVVEDGETLVQYTMDITGHVGLILNGDVEDTKIRIITSPRAFVPTRTRVYGPQSEVHPLVMKIIKTNP